MNIIHENLRKNILDILTNATSVTKGKFEACVSIEVMMPNATCSDSYLYNKESIRDMDFKIIQENLNKKLS